jgi:hypothetical protein
MALRHRDAGNPPGWLLRLSETSSVLARRPISDVELAVPDDVAAQLRRALAEDQRRLRRIWAGPMPDWLDDQSTATNSSASKVDS